MNNWDRLLKSWQIYHIDSLTFGVRAIVVEKAKWKPLELSLPKKIVNQKQHHISGGISEICATIKGLQDTQIWFPPHLPLILSGQCRRQMDHGE